MEAAQEETLATFLNQAEDRLYLTIGNLPEDVKPSTVNFVIADKKKIKAYSRSYPSMARAGQEEIAEYLQEADAFISKYG
ncbi:MAG TPA: hypothetical protein HA282_01450 [Nanoarchaeota archaeon]|nr:MAG: hypothetical protein QT01_C0003G0032 [archaeon GW2011_AR6]MBS3082961.1 hypothetical protein [Candidatus Pacearchaeota archaeon]HIH17332.1 hypothetical protein [Nanoarchaeota archaeon]HIH34778.1 hypothetical protein [Nanoarchaeota archaeon]HIH51210.1 hypothetical protein [Nanoarchaeota archaeon]